ncbi:MAG: hypothetical protein AABW49_01065 [Nanoarchaeota archaeon]
MHKKGQVTVFVVVGLIVLIIVALMLVFLQKPAITQPESVQSNDIKEFTENCVDEVGRDALFMIGLQGGYYNVPTETEPIQRNDPEYGDFQIPHWYIIDEQYLPDFEDIAEQVNLYFKDNFAKCTQNYQTFEVDGWLVSTDEINIETQFPSEETILIATYPLKATKGTSEVSFETLKPIRIPWDVKNTVEWAYEKTAQYSVEGSLTFPQATDNRLLQIFPSKGSWILTFINEKDDMEKKYVWKTAVR